MKHRRLLALWTAFAAVALSGCASPPDRYYTLAGSERVAPGDVAEPRLVVEVLPVTVPERLARPQMLVRRNADGAELRLLDQHRWSSSFESELRDALATGIAGRLGAVDASRAPRTGSGPVWRITVQVRQFDLVESRGVDTAVAWTVRRSDAPDSLTCLRQDAVSAGPGIDSLAEGAQRATANLAEAIAQAIQSARATPAVAQQCPKQAAN